MNKKHALLSASGAKKWMSCTPSARLEERFENTTSIFAEEGTFMHELAELQLKHYLGNSDRTQFMQSFEQIKTNKFYSTEIYDQ